MLQSVAHEADMTQRAIDGPYVYFVTTNTTYRRSFFTSIKRVQLLGRIIANACRMKHFTLLGYAILPDHVHLLVRNDNFDQLRKGKRRFSLSDLMHSIKRNYSRQLNEGYLWQPRFNFRIIEDERRFTNTLEYMQFNFQKHNHSARFGLKPFVVVDRETINSVLGM